MTVRRGGVGAHPRVLCGNADLSFELVKVCFPLLLAAPVSCVSPFFWGGAVNEGWTDITLFPPFWKHDLIFAKTGAAWNQPFPTPLTGSLVSISHTLCPGKA